MLANLVNEWMNEQIKQNKNPAALIYLHSP